MIKVLDKSVSELIAAGEVIEKPASVVKELIENSIDAGAKSITVEIKNGGISFLRITDDGCGIPADECPTAFLRHATSKVSSGEDLTAITTLGFRGEALASVAAVSRVSLLTKTADSQYGTSYKIEGGAEVEHEKSGCPDGTTIIIKDLFFNTPARLKFLKKDVSEGNSVGAVVDKAALINPHIAFRFIRNNSLVRVTPGDGKLYSAVYAVYGKNLAVAMVPVDCSQNGIHVSGYASQPLFCKGSRAFQNFYVNTRSIKSTTCTAALEEAYRNSIMTGKFPACVLDITMNPSDVDANVHPAKTEVRFVNDRAIFSAVHIAVKNALLNGNTENRENSQVQTPEIPQVTERRENSENREALAITYSAKEPIPPMPETLPLSSHKAEYVTAKPKPVSVEYRYINPDSFVKRDKPPVNQGVLIERESREPYRVIGELFSTYIMCEQGEDLVLIDKHAADERIRFDALKSQLRNHSQILLEPVIVRLGGESAGRLLGAADELEQIGIRIVKAEDGDSVKVIAVPTVLEGTSAETLLSEVSELLQAGGEVSFKSLSLADEIMHTVACRAAIKAGDKSMPYDMEHLAEAVLTPLSESETLRYCPHGRPITVRITKREFEKKFKRIL